MRRILALAPALALAACMNTPMGPAAVQQTSQEFNMHTRFGRMEVAVQDVSDDYRPEFGRRHALWHSALHVTDAEVASLRMIGDEDADVTVRIGWYRVDQGDLLTTTVKQKWHRLTGKWRLDGEERLDGAIGILGERVEIITPDTPPVHAQFPTVRLGGRAD